MQNFGGLILPIAFLVILYFIAVRPQQKREKEIRKMREALRVGDKILTIGGIYGKVTKIREDSITVEVGADKTRFNITKWAVGNVVDKKENNKIASKKEDNKEEKKEDKNEKK